MYQAPASVILLSVTTLQLVRSAPRTAPAMSEADRLRRLLATARPDAGFARRYAEAALVAEVTERLRAL